jgi:putative transposase
MARQLKTHLPPASFPQPHGGKIKFEIETVEGFERTKSFANFLIKLERGKLTSALVAEGQERFSVSRASLFRYKAEVQNNPRISTIIDRTKRKRSKAPKYAQAIEDIINKETVRYWRKFPEGNFDDLLKQVNGKLKPHGVEISKSTIWRRFHSLPEAKQHSAKFGSNDAQAKYGTLVGKTPEQTQPLARVQIDSTLCDVWLIHPETGVPIGRAWVTFVLDEFSRCILGFFLTYEAPSAASVAFALEHAIFPKEDWLKSLDVRGEWVMQGVMNQAYTDNGSEFHAEAYRMGCAEWLIDRQYRPVARPRWGGQIERVIGTFMKQMRLLPGAVVKKTLEGDRKGYDPKKHATMTLEALQRHLTIMVLAYHNKKHSALGVTPAQKWRSGMRPGNLAMPIRTPPADAKFLIDFLPVFKPTLQRYGFRVDGLDYCDEAIADFQDLDISTKLIARRNPHDLTRIFVWHPIKRHYIEVRAFNADAPKTLWDLRRAKEFNKNHGFDNSGDSLAQADALIQLQESLDMHRGTKKQSANRQNARRTSSAAIAQSIDAGPSADEVDGCAPPTRNTPFVPTIYAVERF